MRQSRSKGEQRQELPLPLPISSTLLFLRLSLRQAALYGSEVAEPETQQIMSRVLVVGSEGRSWMLGYLIKFDIITNVYQGNITLPARLALKTIMQVVGRIWTLSPLDCLMQESKDSRDLFVAAFDRKEMILRLIKQYKIDAKKYMTLSVAACKDEDQRIRSCGEQDLKELKGSGEKVFLQKWFGEMIERTKLHQSEQNALYGKYRQLQEVSKVKPTTVEDVQKSLLVLSKSKILESCIHGREIDLAELFSFRAVDNLLEECENDYELYEKLFDRKARIVSLVEKKVITPHAYKTYLEEYIKRRIKSQDILFETQKELEGLTLFHNDRVEPWFQELYQEAKTCIEEQAKTLLILKFSYTANRKNHSSPSLSQNQQWKRDLDSTININVNTQTSNSRVEGRSRLEAGSRIIKKEEIKALKNLRVMDQLLDSNRNNPEVYASLFERKRQIWSELKQGKMDGNEYYLMQKDILNTVRSDEIKRTVSQDLATLKQNCKDDVNEWIRLVIDQSEHPYLQQQRLYRQILAHRKSSHQNGSSQQDRQQKLHEFLRAMAAYESLLCYFKTNKISYTQHKYLMEYQNTKKEVYYYLDKHQKDPAYDISNLNGELFPPIDTHIFYAGELNHYKTKIQNIKSALQKQANALDEFKQQIRRMSNSRNIEQAEREIEACLKNRDYLNFWPHGVYQAFPQVRQVKVTKMSTDRNELQPNDIQIEVTTVEGLKEEHILNIYLFDFDNTQHSFRVVNGANKIKFRQRLSQSQYQAVMTGSQKYLMFKLFKKGFFGGLNSIGEKAIETQFASINTEFTRISFGQISVNCAIMVREPSRPLEFEIDHLQIKTFPEYKHNSFIEGQFIKKMMPYSNPSASEISA